LHKKIEKPASFLRRLVGRWCKIPCSFSMLACDVTAHCSLEKSCNSTFYSPSIGKTNSRTSFIWEYSLNSPYNDLFFNCAEHIIIPMSTWPPHWGFFWINTVMDSAGMQLLSSYLCLLKWMAPVHRTSMTILQPHKPN